MSASTSETRQIFKEGESVVKIIRRKRITIRQRESIAFRKNEESNEICPLCHAPIHRETLPKNEIREIEEKIRAANFYENEKK